MTGYLWMKFLVSAVFVIAAGLTIGRLSGEIGERLGLGRAWAGAVLLSLATTLPELVSTITLTLRGSVGMAVGGILGSIVFNLFILVLVDLADPEPIYHRISLNHIFTGILGCVLLGIVLIGLSLGMTGYKGPKEISLGFVGVTSLGLITIYGLGQYVLFRLAKSGNGEEKPVKLTTRFDRFTTGKLFLIYGAVAAVIFIVA